MSTGRRLIDLSHVISDNMLTNPWVPKPRVTEFISRDQSHSFCTDGVSYLMAQVSMPGSTGTYMDAPYQFHEDGADMTTVPLEQLFDIPIVVVRVTDQKEIGPELFEGRGDLTGAAVLVNTDHARHWGTGEFFKDSPYLTAEAVEYLLSVEPLVVGIDSQNIDNGTDKAKPAQHLLLGAGIVLLECLNRLGEVDETGARLRVLPTPIQGMGSFPVRPVALVDG